MIFLGNILPRSNDKGVGRLFKEGIEEIQRRGRAAFNIAADFFAGLGTNPASPGLFLIFAYSLTGKVDNRILVNQDMQIIKKLFPPLKQRADWKQAL